MKNETLIGQTEQNKLKKHVQTHEQVERKMNKSKCSNDRKWINPKPQPHININNRMDDSVNGMKCSYKSPQLYTPNKYNHRCRCQCIKTNNTVKPTEKKKKYNENRQTEHNTSRFKLLWHRTGCTEQACVPSHQFEPMKAVVERVISCQCALVVVLNGRGQFSGTVVHLPHLLQPLPAGTCQNHKVLYFKYTFRPSFPRHRLSLVLK